MNDYVRVNARVGITAGRMSAELFVRNAFDDKNWNSGVLSTSLAEPGSLLFVPYNAALTTVPAMILQPADHREFGLRANCKS